MIINPTKKSLPIFNKLIKTADVTKAKQFSIANPLFSWHANYFLVNRKKVVLLVNDLTYAAVVLYDISAKNKSNLDQYIVAGMREAFLSVGVKNERIDAYLELAGTIEIGAGFDRHVTGAVTNMITLSSGGRLIDPRKMIQSDLMKYLMRIPFRQKEYTFATKAVLKAFASGLSIVESHVAETQTPVYHVNKTWTDYHQWDKYEGDRSLFADDGQRYERIMKEVQANNAQILTEFKNYLANSAGLSKKVVNKHANNVDLFINQFMLYYTIKTPLKMADDVADYLSDWFPRKVAYSPNEIKSNATSIKKFAKFMEVAGELSQSDGKRAKAAIKMGTELGVEQMLIIDNMSDIW